METNREFTKEEKRLILTILIILKNKIALPHTKTWGEAIQQTADDVNHIYNGVTYDLVYSVVEHLDLFNHE